MQTDEFVAGEFVLEAWRAATFQAGYNVSVVVAGATCLGIAAGVVGSFTFLLRRALVSDPLSHTTLPGLALAFLLRSEDVVYGTSVSVRVDLRGPRLTKKKNN